MEPRPHQLPPDQRYCIDTAFEQGEIGPFAHQTLHLYGDPASLDSILDRPRSGRGWLHGGRGAIAIELDEYAHWIATFLNEATLRMLFASHLLIERARLTSDGHTMAFMRYEDETRGGANLPFRDHPRCRRDHTAAPRAMRKLTSPKAIRRYVKHSEPGIGLLYRRPMIERLRRLPWPASLDEACPLVEIMEQQLRAHRLEADRRWRAFFDERSGSLPRPGRPFLRAERKMIRKSAGVAAGFVGERAVSTFVHGGTVALVGALARYEVSLHARLADCRGHGALSVAAFDPGGARLGNICVFFERTPPLDQLAALAMYIAAGEERAILERGNFFNVTAAGACHELVRAKQESAPWRRGLYGDQHAVWNAYADEFCHLYAEALTTRLWGRDAKRMLALTERRAA